MLWLFWIVIQILFPFLKTPILTCYRNYNFHAFFLCGENSYIEVFKEFCSRGYLCKRLVSWLNVFQPDSTLVRKRKFVKGNHRAVQTASRIALANYNLEYPSWLEWSVCIVNGISEIGLKRTLDHISRFVSNLHLSSSRTMVVICMWIKGKSGRLFVSHEVTFPPPGSVVAWLHTDQEIYSSISESAVRFFSSRELFHCEKTFRCGGYLRIYEVRDSIMATIFTLTFKLLYHKLRMYAS